MTNPIDARTTPYALAALAVRFNPITDLAHESLPRALPVSLPNPDSRAGAAAGPGRVAKLGAQWEMRWGWAS